MTELQIAVETLENLFYLIRKNAGDTAGVEQLTELAKGPMETLGLHANRAELMQKRIAQHHG